MTDMKFAVVPVDDDTKTIETFDEDVNSQGYFSLAQCKLTREQIETMAHAVAKELGEDFDNLGDDENIGWSKNHCRRLVVAAVKSVGFGVEGE